MPFASQGSLWAAVEAAADIWKMGFTSAHYLLFLPLAAGVYFLLPARWRRGWLLTSSYYFYFFAAPGYLPVLLGLTLLSWLCGLFIAAAASPASRGRRLFLGVALLVLGLCVFKYGAFLTGLFSPPFLPVESPGYFSTAGALGLSFQTFTAIAYLADIARDGASPERNLLDYAIFIGFFPSVLMGPISRADNLLPQLKDTSRRFNADAAAGALRTMAAGFFKKLAVADTLAVFVTPVFANPASYRGATLTVAAACFALQLYFDFSGFTDIALASAKLFGISLPQNFRNPYFSTNFSSFWQRWHISLSSWLQDYVFTPLVWSRWTDRLPLIGRKVQKPPVISSVAIVFLVSGLWHGDTLCFVVWGALQAVFRIGEELLHRRFGKPGKNPPFWLRAAKTAVILVLWTESLVFFRVGQLGGNAADALACIAHQFIPVSPAAVCKDIFSAVQLGFYNDWRIALLFIGFSAACLSLAVAADCKEHVSLKGEPAISAAARLKAPARWGIYLLLTVCCFIGFIAISGGFGGSNFLYGGF